MKIGNIFKKNSEEKQDFPTPKESLTNFEDQQLSDLQELFPEGREFLMYEDSAIQIVFSVQPQMTRERMINLKDHGFSILAQYNSKCCTDYVFIINKKN